MIELIPTECSFIASKLVSRAKDKTKNLARAVERGWHPELVRKLREEVSECERLATVLRGDVG